MIHWIGDTAVDEAQIKGHLSNLVFMGCFFIGLIAVGIWWLKRNA
jgi:hypothetical protein